VYYGQLQGVAQAGAFSVAGLASLAQLQAVLDSLVAAQESGDTFKKWSDRVRQNDIDLSLPRYRLENIFRTNIQGHYARGRCEQQAEVVADFPYYMYDAVNDSRTRPAHSAMDGFVAKADDPIWGDWNPPNGYQCRCRRIALTNKQGERFHKIDQARMAKNPVLWRDRQSAVIDGPDKGWNYNIGVDLFKGINAAIEEQKTLIDLLKIPQEKIPTVNYPWTGIGLKSAIDWHDHSFAESSKAMKKVAAQYHSKLRAVKNDDLKFDGTPESTHYRDSDVSINMPTSHNKKTTGGQGVWRHEYGHFYDFQLEKEISGTNGSGWSERPFFTEPMEADAKTLIANKIPKKIDAFVDDKEQLIDLLMRDSETFHSTMAAHYKKLRIDYEKLKQGLEKQTYYSEVIGDYPKNETIVNLYLGLKYKLGQKVMDALEFGEGYWSYHNSAILPMLSDAIAAATKREIKGCASHDAEYFNREGSRQKEIFANLFSIAGDNNPVWMRIAEILMPKSVKAFKVILK
jgi:SPP1 gp7 family putative phage head morphogenesis protein